MASQCLHHRGECVSHSLGIFFFSSRDLTITNRFAQGRHEWILFRSLFLFGGELIASKGWGVMEEGWVAQVCLWGPDSGGESCQNVCLSHGWGPGRNQGRGGSREHGRSSGFFLMGKHSFLPHPTTVLPPSQTDSEPVGSSLLKTLPCQHQ